MKIYVCRFVEKLRLLMKYISIYIGLHGKIPSFLRIRNTMLHVRLLTTNLDRNSTHRNTIHSNTIDSRKQCIYSCRIYVHYRQNCIDAMHHNKSAAILARFWSTLFAFKRFFIIMRITIEENFLAAWI